MKKRTASLIAIALALGLAAFGAFWCNETRTSMMGAVIFVTPGFEGRAEFVQVDNPYAESGEGPSNLYRMVDGKIEVEQGCMPVRDWKFIRIVDAIVSDDGIVEVPENVPENEQRDLVVVEKSRRNDEPQYIVVERR